MSIVITACEQSTWAGDGQATIAAIFEGRPSRSSAPPALPGLWLTRCVRVAADRAGLDLSSDRVMVIASCGLRDLIEDEAGEEVHAAEARFATAVHDALPQIRTAVTITAERAATGGSIALACELLQLGQADAVVVIGCDTPAGAARSTTGGHLPPILGPGGAVVVLTTRAAARSLGRHVLGHVLGVGLSADVPTAFDPAAIASTISVAHLRAGVDPAEVDLVVADSPTTSLDFRHEASGLARVFAENQPGPLVTTIAGALDQTPGGAPLHSVAVALHSLQSGWVPPAAGPPPVTATKINLVLGTPSERTVRIAQVNALGAAGTSAFVVLGSRAR
ncbi:3-oxoacyl-[acyl-carrier-protein] synthase II [Allocatelliglobosispora scoriae]|uniref:3-oxoacyl-[acyl-carrier-protein] synthase II n=1 Tax=Allocatelliglobosispora scoriae TaxID=643052 RepID=A0A841BPP9_9ACTN|nr:hypothetical protein [Allocatelliglobosispora scoriae]MBB5868923.1 3-oxoacyl-[acyl-carrier-protein] synthase II [Allocatelliglobosispora scoriae]